MTPYEIVRENLAATIANRRLTQAACARQVGRERGWFSELLRGVKSGREPRDDITLGTLADLARAVGVHPARLLLPRPEMASVEELVEVMEWLAEWMVDAAAAMLAKMVVVRGRSYQSAAAVQYEVLSLRVALNDLLGETYLSPPHTPPPETDTPGNA